LGILYVYMHKGGVYRALHGIQILCRIMVFADVDGTVVPEGT
jgi:hypothetical protein